MITAEKRFTTGENFYSQHLLGAHRMKAGYVFRVWAPNAQNVWLVGDFNQWDDSLPMTKRSESGIWEITAISLKKDSIINSRSSKPTAVKS